MNEDDYLWDPASGTPDDDVQRLEQALAPLRMTEPMPPTATRRARSSRSVGRLAVAIVAASVLAAWLWARQVDEPTATPPNESVASWQVHVDGEPTGRLAVGDWLDTQRSDWTDVEVPEIGRLAVARDSRLRLLRTGQHEHRLELRRGHVRATISAPPRLFIVETPAATAVDLGCVYELEVDAQGRGRLRVDAGWVAMEHPDRVVRVPAGFSCAMRGKGLIGVPVHDASPEALRTAVGDFEGGRTAALDDVIRIATEDDAITLFHLIPVADEEARGALVDVLARWAPLPAATSRADIVQLEPAALERWWVQGLEGMR